MSRTPGAGLGALVIATLATGLAAAGAGGAGSGAPDLGRFLMRHGEEPGFRTGPAPGATPRRRETITGVKAFVKENRLSAADARRLRSEGFISFTVEPIHAPRTAGLSNVALYRTAKGARHSKAHDLSADVIRAS